MERKSAVPKNFSFLLLFSQMPIGQEPAQSLEATFLNSTLLVGALQL